MRDPSENDQSSDHEELPMELKAFEARLASLVPTGHGIDSEALAFEAGRQAAVVEIRSRRLRFVWPTAFAVMTTVASVLAVMLMIPPDPIVVVRYIPREDVVTSNGTPGQETTPREEVVDNRSLPESPREPEQLPRVLDQETKPTFTFLKAIEESLLLPRQQQIERLLTGDMDAAFVQAAYANPPRGNGSARRAAPTEPYWQMRNRVLEENTIAWPSAEVPPTKDPTIPGANS